MTRKNFRKEKTLIAPLVLLSFSLLTNALFVFLYFYKINPHTKSLEEKIIQLESNKEIGNCKRVYSLSTGKVVCLTKTIALEKCSKDFREKLSENTKLLIGLRDIDDLEKLRKFMMKMCMQEKGFDY